ncbi:hypothetical protein QTP88_008367 [Uroleucon formosanum]
MNGDFGAEVFTKRATERREREKFLPTMDRHCNDGLPTTSASPSAAVDDGEPITTIIGGPDMFINKGSTMNLTCIIKHSPEPPPLIYWTHDSKSVQNG